MTRPRRHIPGQLVMLTRRCLHRRYLLRPDNWINSVVPFEIGRASTNHGLSIHAVMTMSNHIHTMATDSDASRSEFMRDVMREISKARNRHLGRTDSLWDGRPFDETIILDREAIERKLLYVWLNPVRAGLVRRAEDWPGFKILPRHWGKTFKVECPSQVGYYGRYSPEVVEFTPQPPPGYDEMSLEEVREHFEELLREAEDEILEERRGKSIAGPKKIRATDPFSSPETEDSRGSTGPRFASKNAELQSRANARYNQFLSDYEKQRQRWVKGKAQVRFPAGTVWLRKCTPCRCREVDDAEPGLFCSGAPPG